MRILVAMSGGVDSSVAAALLVDAGHEVVGATMKLWGGAGDSGCCSVADVADARRVADHLGIDHHVFNFTESFNAHVVDPYVEAHRQGATPNPCIECNRHLKFDAFLDRARRLGFEAIATGHYARVIAKEDGHFALTRGEDPKKDQSYVLSMLTQEQLRHLLLPIGEMEKSATREYARSRGLRTAEKPESQEVCFIASHTKGVGRGSFLQERIALHAGTVIERESGVKQGEVPAIELVTIGQRRGIGTANSGRPRYVVDVDLARRQVIVGDQDDLLVDGYEINSWTFVDAPLAMGAEVLVQASAHGRALPARLTPLGVTLHAPSRRIAPGQIVACYLGDHVVASGVIAR